MRMKKTENTRLLFASMPLKLQKVESGINLEPVALLSFAYICQANDFGDTLV